jgi:tetratricopeptide (TPR) repeat protein
MGQQLRRLIAVALSLAWLGGAAQAAADDPLAEARRFFVAGLYEQAIVAAEGVLAVPALAASARIIVGRSRLELYRLGGRPEDLDAARQALRELDATTLPDRERTELLVGLGVTLYYEQEFGAAAEVFDGAVERAGQLGPPARHQVLDWWATALDREAQSRAGADRDAAYETLGARMMAELQRDETCTPASFWIAAAARARGDLERAWDAALAGWLRAVFATDGGAALRADLDMLVLQGIIPDRSRRAGGDPQDIEKTVTALADEWESFKSRWTGKE